MISLTSEYALRAMIYLAQHTEAWPVSGREIAKHTGIPAKYLSAVLSSLVRTGVLESTRGKSGGFRMVRSPRETRLSDVLSPFEPLSRRRCPFGNVACSDEDPCAAHDRWKKVVASMERFLEKTSVQDIAARQRDRKARKRAGR